MGIPTKNKYVIQWVKEIADLVTPDQVYWCDGTEAENKKICE